jgi:hypothetical protein
MTRYLDPARAIVATTLAGALAVGFVASIVQESATLPGWNLVFLLAVIILAALGVSEAAAKLWGIGGGPDEGSTDDIASGGDTLVDGERVRIVDRIEDQHSSEDSSDHE